VRFKEVIMPNGTHQNWMIDFLAKGGTESPEIDYMLAKAADYATKDKLTIDEKGMHFHGKSPEKVGEKKAEGETRSIPTPGAQPPAQAGPTPEQRALTPFAGFGPVLAEQRALTPFAGFGPVLAALAGPQAGGVSAATLTGMTPEQITGLLGAESQKEKLRQGTIGQLLRMPYMQALTAKALRPDVTKPAEQWTYGKDEEGNWIRVNVATGKPELITRAKAPEKPLTRSRGYNWTKTDEAGKTVDRVWLPVGEVPKGPGWERDPVTQIREVSDLPERKFEYLKLRKSSDARADIRSGDLSLLESKKLITQANEGSPDPSLFVYDTRWGNEVLEVNLPEGFVADHFTATMTDALGRGKTIRVKHPVTGKPVRLIRRGGRLFAGENKIEIIE